MLFIILVGAISAASAADFNATDAVAADDANEVINIEDDEVITVDNDDDLSQSSDSKALGKNITPSGKSFTDIQNAINSAEEGDTIILDGAYTQNIVDDWDVVIEVTKKVNIVGINNAVLKGSSAKHENRIMGILANGVVLNNITIQNGRIPWGNPAGGLCCDGYNFTIENCKFINNYAYDDGNHDDHPYHASGGAIVLINSICTIKNSYFNGNHALVYGGMMFVKGNSKVNIYNSSFVGNYVTNDGGAIDVHDSAECNIFDSYFERNSANYGGALYFGGSSQGNLVNCSFVENSANYGGAISLGPVSGKNVNVRILNSSFISNTAKSGGAICCEMINSCLIYDSYFRGNYASVFGGAIFNSFNSPYVNSMGIYDSIFEDNHADTRGGAVHITGTLNTVIEDCQFDRCFSGNEGGAVFLNDCNDVKITDSRFNSCSIGVSGGAVYSCGNSQITIDNSSFMDNSASHGGATCVAGNTNLIINNSRFEHNNAPYGGATLVHDYAKQSIIDSSFKSNSASYGGAVGCIHGNKIVSVDIVNSYFENNSATIYGGVCYLGNPYDSPYINNANLNIVGSVFKDSYSPEGGSILLMCDEGLINIENSSFENSNGLYGAAIDCYGLNNINIADCNFSNFHVVKQGGAVALDTVNNAKIINSNFINCSADENGGGIRWYSGNNMDISLCSFEKCSDSSNTGAIWFGTEVSNSDVSDCIFDVAPQGISYHYATFLTANDLSIVLGDSGIIQVNLSNFRGPLSRKTINFNVNDVDYQRNTTSNGIATFNVKDILKEFGSYNVTVGFAGDGVNDAISKTVNVRINDYIGELSVSQSGRYYGEKSLTFKLVDRDGNPVSDWIKISSSGGSVTKKTDANGIFTYSMSAFAPGNYNVIAYVDSSKVDVNGINENVEISKISGVIELTKSNSNKTLNIQLINKTTGDVFKGITVNLRFTPNDVAASVVTDANGFASYPMQFEKGTYTVVASVDSSGYKEFAEAELGNIVISTEGKEDSVVEFNNAIVFDYLSNGSTTLKLGGCEVTRECCSVDGHPEAVISVSNSNTVTVSDLKVGSYILRITSKPDVYHNAVTRTVGITVNKIDSTLSINPVSINYGNPATVKATVVGGGISYEGVSVVGQTPVINVLNNEITVTGLPAGTHTLKVSTTPTENYNSVTKTTKITVKKVNSNIGFDTPMSFVYGTVGSISLKLDGCEIVKDGCTIVDHNEAVIDVDENVVKVSNLSAGSYTLRISSTPDSNHNAVTQDIVVTVTRADSDVDLKTKPLTFDYGTVGQSALILDGCSVLSDDVTVLEYANANTWVTDNVVYVSNLPANTYTLQIKTTPDGNHKSVTKTFKVTVNKPLSSVEFIGSADFDYLGIGKTTLKLVGGSVVLDDIEVVGYKDAGISLGKGNIVSISDLDSGNYTLKVKTIPDANHRANTATLKFTVNKINSNVIFTKDVISFKYNEIGSTPVVLDNCEIANMTVIGHDDSNVELVDDEILVSGLSVGNYVLKVTTKPTNDNYKSVDAYINVSVSKNTAKFTVSSASVALKANSYWKITLKDAKGNPISGMKVTLKLYKNNKLYKTITNLKTDANGVASYKTSGLPVGTYKGVFSISHNGYVCNDASSSIKVIKPIPLKFKLVKKQNGKDGSLLSYIVTNKNTGKALNGVKLKVLIYTGKTYKTYTLKTKKIKSGKVYNGAFGFSTNSFKAGKHTVKIMPADKVKYSGSVTTSISITKSAAKKPKFFRII